MSPRSRRSPARFLAPLALIAVMVALLAIVSGSGVKGGSSDSKASTGAQTTPAGVTTTTASGKVKVVKPKSTRRRYTVKVGDNLSTIAAKTGVSVDTLQALNPAVDPHAMTAGQKIRLR